MGMLMVTSAAARASALTPWASDPTIQQVCVVTDPAIVTGTNYRATQILSDGSEGTWRYTAT